MMDIILVSEPINIQDVNQAPNTPGLYVWYARFTVGEADWHTEYADGNDLAQRRLLKAIRSHSMKFGRQEMKIQAETNFSSVWNGVLKEDITERWHSQSSDNATDGFDNKIGVAIQKNEMREVFVRLLEKSFPLFCSPLYLGKAVDQTLRERLKQHRKKFLDQWDIYSKDREFIERLVNPKNFAERAIKYGFSPEDLFCITLSFNENFVSNLSLDDISALIDSSEWILNRWSTPFLGKQ